MAAEHAQPSLIAEAVRAAVSEQTAADALAALVRALEEQYSLWRASLVVEAPGTGLVVVAAVWSAVETLVPAGTGLAPEQSVLALVAAADGPVVDQKVAGTLHLDLLRDEGVRSRASIPLRDAGRVAGALNLGSSRDDAFSADDLPLLAGLGAGLEERLLRLGREAVS